VDHSGNALTYDGTSWSSPDSIDAANQIISVSCPTTSFCVAVDSVGNVFTYNGSSWSSPEKHRPGDRVDLRLVFDSDLLHGGGLEW
jgi:hypothetical protein